MHVSFFFGLSIKPSNAYTHEQTNELISGWLEAYIEFMEQLYSCVGNHVTYSFYFGNTVISVINNYLDHMHLSGNERMWPLLSIESRVTIFLDKKIKMNCQRCLLSVWLDMAGTFFRLL